MSQPRHKGPWREESRHPMLWGDIQDTDLLDYTKNLVAFRRAHPALVYGEVVTHRLDDKRSIWLAERRHGADRVWIGVNVGREQVQISLPGGNNRVIEMGPMTCQLWAA